MVGCSRAILVWFERRHGFQTDSTVELCPERGGRLITRCVIVQADKICAVY